MDKIKCSQCGLKENEKEPQLSFCWIIESGDIAVSNDKKWVTCDADGKEFCGCDEKAEWIIFFCNPIENEKFFAFACDKHKEEVINEQLSSEGIESLPRNEIIKKLVKIKKSTFIFRELTT
jgi:hypothetical protein